MATPTPTTCDLDFYISDVKTGRLSELGQLSDAHRNVDAESDTINKIDGKVAVYEISYVNTKNYLTGFQFRIPLERLGLDPNCTSVLGVYGGFDGTAGQAELFGFRLYNKENYIVGLFDPLQGNISRVEYSVPDNILCYVIVGGKDCSFGAGDLSIFPSLEDKNGSTDGVDDVETLPVTLLESSPSWFLFYSETESYFESLIQATLSLAFTKGYDLNYDSRVQSGEKIDIIDLTSIVYKAHKIFKGEITNKVVPSYCCAEVGLGLKCSSEILISCVECYPSSQSSALGGEPSLSPGLADLSSNFDCSGVSVVEDVQAYCDQRDSNLLLNSELEPYNMEIIFSVSSDQSISGVQFDLGCNVLDSSCSESRNVFMNPAVSSSKNWSLNSASIENRFGFDSVTRFAAFQKPVLQPDSLNQEFSNPTAMTRIHTSNSIYTNGKKLSFIKFIISDCIPKATKCPKTYYVYAEDLNITVGVNLLEPGSIKAGMKYYGQVVKKDDSWWTSSDGTWTPSSLLLEKKWEGLEIFNIKVVTNEHRDFLQHESQRLSYKGTELFYNQTIDTSVYPDYSSFYNTIYDGVYLEKLLYNGLDSDPEVSAYSYLSSYDATFAGYELDGNLDGKFDIADLVAFVNLGQMRMLTPFGDGVFSGTVGSDSTGADTGQSATANIDSFWRTYDLDNFLTNSQELTNIVPGYTCVKDFTTCTYPKTCPDIRTLDRGTSVVNISQRVDIEPDRAASVEIAFLDAAPVGSTITLVDWNGLSYVYEFGSLVSGNVQVTIGTGATPQLRAEDQSSELRSAIIAGTGGISQDFATPLDSGGKITITNNKVGDRGNTKISYTTDIKTVLSKFPSAFGGGSTYLSSLPKEFKDWYRYFNDVHQISYLESTDIRLLQNGGTFFEVDLCTNDHDLNFINSAEFTLNVCDAYYSGDDVKAFILSDEAFNSFTVKDSSDASISPTDGFYTIPVDGIIKVKCTESDNSIPSPAIMHDGGQFRIAKVLLNRKPEFQEERTFKITAAEINYRDKPRGVINGATGQLDPTGSTITESDKVELGPVSSIYSQFYEDNSSSIHGYSDYTLHIEAVAEDVFDIIYNTKKTFRRFNFAIKTWNCAEFESFKSNVGVPSYTGWTIENDNAISTTEDGYFVISGYSDPYSEPVGLIGNGILCRVKLNKKVYEGSVLSTGDRFVCPPIGLSGDVVIPNLKDSFNGEKDYPSNWKTDAELTVLEAQGTTQRFGTQANDTSAIQLLDASKNFVNSIQSNSSDKVTKWVAAPGIDLIPHLDDINYAPSRGASFVSFDRSVGQGLYSDPSTYLRTKNITSWMATLVVDPDMDTTPNNEGVIVKNFGTNVGTTQPEIEIKIDPDGGLDSAGQLKVNVVTTASTVNLSYDYRTLPADGIAMNTRQIITFAGTAGGDTSLYINGSLVPGTVANAIPNTLTDDDWGWAVGYNGTTDPEKVTSEPFNGDLYEFIFYADSVTDEFRQLAEAYLALKYSLQTLLPKSHIGHDDGTGNSFTFLTSRNLDVESTFAMKKFKEATRTGIKPGRSTKSGAKWVASRTCINKKNRNLFNIKDDV